MGSKAFAVDLGTDSLKIYKKNDGVIFNEKNMIAVCDRKVKAVGDEAYEMYGKAPDSIQISYPVRGGVVADIEHMNALFNITIDRLTDKYGKMMGSDVVVAVPTDITEVEKRAFFDIASNSIARPKRVRVVEMPIANAIGLDLDIMNCKGIMVIDVGADTTEISIMSLGGILLSKLVKIGGNTFNDSIINNMKKKYNSIIGEKTAELIKKSIGYAVEPEAKSIKVFGRDVMTGLPKESEVPSDFVNESITDNLNAIIDAVRIVLEKTPPEIAADIIDSGVYLTGGSANMPKMAQLFEKEIELNVHVMQNPENSVVVGLGKILENPDEYDKLALSLRQSYYMRG